MAKKGKKKRGNQPRQDGFSTSASGEEALRALEKLKKQKQQEEAERARGQANSEQGEIDAFLNDDQNEEIKRLRETLSEDGTTIIQDNYHNDSTLDQGDELVLATEKGMVIMIAEKKSFKDKVVFKAFFSIDSEVAQSEYSDNATNLALFIDQAKDAGIDPEELFSFTVEISIQAQQAAPAPEVKVAAAPEIPEELKDLAAQLESQIEEEQYFRLDHFNVSKFKIDEATDDVLRIKATKDHPLIVINKTPRTKKRDGVDLSPGVPRGYVVDINEEQVVSHVWTDEKRKFDYARIVSPEEVSLMERILQTNNKNDRLAALARIHSEISAEIDKLSPDEQPSDELRRKLEGYHNIRWALGMSPDSGLTFSKTKVKSPEPAVAVATPSAPEPVSPPEKKIVPPTFKPGDVLKNAHIERGRTRLIVSPGQEYAVTKDGETPRQADDSRNIIIDQIVLSDGRLIEPDKWRPILDFYTVIITEAGDQNYKANVSVSLEEEFLQANFITQEKTPNKDAQERQRNLDKKLIPALSDDADKSYRDLSDQLMDESDQRYEALMTAQSPKELEQLEEGLKQEIKNLKQEVAAARQEYILQGTRNQGTRVGSERTLNILVKEIRDKTIRLDYLMLLQSEWNNRHTQAIRDIVNFQSTGKKGIDLARNFTRALREVMGSFAYEAKADTNTGELTFVDLDSSSAQDIFELAGVTAIKQAKPVRSGASPDQAIALDTSNKAGVGLEVQTTEESSQYNPSQRRDLKGSEADAFTRGVDIDETRAFLSGPQKTKWKAWIDHHGPASGRDTSTTKFIYETLRELGALTDQGMAKFIKESGLLPQDGEPERIVRAVEAAVDFVTKADNFTLPGMDNQEAYLRSHSTLVGLYRRLRIKDLIHYFYHNPSHQGTEVLTDEQLKIYPLGNKGDQAKTRLEKPLSDSSDNKRKYIEGNPRDYNPEKRKPVTQIMEEMEREGFMVPTKYGEIYVNISRRLGFGNETTWGVSNGTRGCLDWQPESEHIFISFPSAEFNPEDVEWAGLKVVRQTMIVKPDNVKGMPLSLRELLINLGTPESAIQGKLLEYIEQEEKRNVALEEVKAELLEPIIIDLRQAQRLFLRLDPSRGERYAQLAESFLASVAQKNPKLVPEDINQLRQILANL